MGKAEKQRDPAYLTDTYSLSYEHVNKDLNILSVRQVRLLIYITVYRATRIDPV